MNSIYVFTNIPSPIKRLILYFTGQGTPISGLIKEEYDKIINKSTKMTTNIGFMGHKACLQPFYIRKAYVNQYIKYNSDIDDYLLEQQIYEIEGAKIFYLYHYSNENKFRIMLSLRSDNHDLEKLFRRKILKMYNEV